MSLKSSILREVKQGPRTAKQLRAALGADAKKIAKALKALVSDGKLFDDKGVFSVYSAEKAKGGKPSHGVEATISKLGRNFAFAAPTDGSGDIFIPGHSLMGAMPGDVVNVMPAQHPRVPGSREGEVTAIITPNQRVVGVVQQQEGRLVLVPDNARETPLVIRKSADGGAKEGEKVAGEILERGERHQDHRVGVSVRFGSADSARQCAKAILYAAGIVKSFPEEVKENAREAAGEKVARHTKGRTDLRELPIFTIDGAVTKDIDDAISAEKTPHGYSLGVHIADVSHYVAPKTPLDEEALRRGTSVYYADNVVPMLPRQLSNGICSLNPGEDRLAFSCLMELDEDGRMVDYRFVKTVIRSRVKGVYDEVNALLAGGRDEALTEKYAGVAQPLGVMREIYGKLAQHRAARGAMEIESEEAKLVLNAEGVCVGVEKRTRGDAERMIEEFMLLANSAAAHLARRMDIPFVYRVHDKPAADRVENLKALLTAAGLTFRFQGETPTQAELAALLNETRGTNLERPVHNGVLRTMAKAKYEPAPKGHYGLALDDYAHFTSPIRRYPDLAIHRILSDVVRGAAPEELRKKYTHFAAVASADSTAREITAQQVERDCDDCYKAEFMKPFLGQEFDGVVSSVVPFGIYVELPNTVEGLIHISLLSEKHMNLVEGVCLTEEGGGKCYRLGDALRVKLAGVDIAHGNVDFVPAE